MSKITFVEPASTFNGYAWAKIPLLGTLYLGTLLKQEGHDVTILTESVKKVYSEGTGTLHESLLSSDIVGFTTMTSTANRAYKIADAIKERKPDTKVIMGGPHVSVMPEEAIQHADVVVKGEAEPVISQVINGNGSNGSENIIQGEHVEDLDTLPFPDFDILEHKNKLRRLAPLATSRGCPFNCKFCYVSPLFGRRYRFRSPDNVLGELQMRVEQGYGYFFFYDDNFGASKEMAKTMLDGVLTKNLKFKWMAQSRVEVARDDELLGLMQRSNCRHVLVGFESANPDVLKEFNKKQEVEDIRRCINQLHKYNIKVHGMFIIGADEDDTQTIEHTVKFCHEMNLDYAQFSILFPIPGTQLYDELDSQGRIFTKNWSWYDGTHVVFHPMKMSFLELQEKFIWTWKKFYNLKKWQLYPLSRYLIRQWQKCNEQFSEWLREFAAKTQNIRSDFLKNLDSQTKK